MTKPIIQFRVPDGTDLDAWLTGRAVRMNNAEGLSRQARSELVLWRAALRAELRRVQFTVGQLCCIADVLKSTMLDATISTGGAGMVYADVAYEFTCAAGSYGSKWGINESELLAKLAGIGPVADHALRDGMARWWADGHASTDLEVWQVYGFNVTADPVRVTVWREINHLVGVGDQVADERGVVWRMTDEPTRPVLNCTIDGIVRSWTPDPDEPATLVGGG